MTENNRRAVLSDTTGLFAAHRKMPLREYPHFTADGTLQTIVNDLSSSLHHKLIQTLEDDLSETLEHNYQLPGRLSTQLPPLIPLCLQPIYQLRTYSHSSHHLLNMPTEILTNILSYLHANDITTISLVCKRLYWQSLDENLWKQLFRSHFGSTRVPQDLIHQLQSDAKGNTEIPLWKQLFIERWLFALQHKPLQAAWFNNIDVDIDF